MELWNAAPASTVQNVAHALDLDTPAEKSSYREIAHLTDAQKLVCRSKVRNLSQSIQSSGSGNGPGLSK